MSQRFPLIVAGIGDRRLVPLVHALVRELPRNVHVRAVHDVGHGDGRKVGQAVRRTPGRRFDDDRPLRIDLADGPRGAFRQIVPVVAAFFDELLDRLVGQIETPDRLGVFVAPGHPAPHLDELVLHGAVGKQPVVRADVAADGGLAARRRVQVHDHVDAVPLAQRQRGVQTLQFPLQPGVVIRQRTGLARPAVADQLPADQVGVPVAAQGPQAVLVDVRADHRAAQARQVVAFEGDSRRRGGLGRRGRLGDEDLDVVKTDFAGDLLQTQHQRRRGGVGGDLRADHGPLPVKRARVQRPLAATACGPAFRSPA